MLILLISIHAAWHKKQFVYTRMASGSLSAYRLSVGKAPVPQARQWLATVNLLV
jgi:hypothetical protein